MSSPIKAFVIGHPVAHSRSPLMHRYWLAELGIAGTYEAIDVSPQALPAFIDDLRAGAFAGGNVTVPLKEAVIPLCDRVEDTARAIGAVNTLMLEDGVLVGRNTDWLGFSLNLDHAAPGWDQAKGTAIVLGAGGAARAIVMALLQRGFARIAVLNRTPARAARLAADFTTGNQEVTGHGLEDFAQIGSRAELVVNASTIGMKDTRFKALPLRGLPETAIVADSVYTPLKTPLLRDAAELGLRTVDGLGMLLYQGVPGFAAWFGKTPRVTPQLRRLLEQSLEAQ